MNSVEWDPRDYNPTAEEIKAHMALAHPRIFYKVYPGGPYAAYWTVSVSVIVRGKVCVQKARGSPGNIDPSEDGVLPHLLHEALRILLTFDCGHKHGSAYRDVERALRYAAGVRDAWNRQYCERKNRTADLHNQGY